ncbi:hypothetical protein BDF21DRAFT_396180 [Thamnidium elegans]|nr:hypothetical protein BDF21DRAFT_396180 [Thamnidium elegans]
MILLIMKRKKPTQRSQYRGEKPLHPTFSNHTNKRKHSETSVKVVEKKAHTEESSNTYYERYFQLSMEKKLGEMIRAITSKNSKTKEKLLNALKIKQYTVTKLPQSIISDTVLIENSEIKMTRFYRGDRIGISFFCQRSIYGDTNRTQTV